MAFFLGVVAAVVFCIFGGYLVVELGPVGFVLWLALAFVVSVAFRSFSRYVGDPY